MEAEAQVKRVAAELVPGGDLVRTQRLHGGVSADVFRLDITTSQGETEQFVYRQHRSPEFKGSQATTAELEHGVLSALHGAGLCVPEPIVARSARDSGPSYLVMEWIEGTTELGETDLCLALDQMAQFLVELHGIDVSQLAIPGLDPIEHPVSGLRSYRPEGPAGDHLMAVLGRLPATWKVNPPVLVHGDFWPGNIIWNAGQLAAVIDWEDVCLGDPLADLATARVELACAFGTEAMVRFTETYYLESEAASPGRLQVAGLAVWELYVSASALATMHDWGLDADAEAERRGRTQRFYERALLDLKTAVW